MLKKLLRPLRPYVRGIRFLAVPIGARVVFLGRGSMHLDVAEPRAQSILRSGGITQGVVARLFERLNDLARPALTLDIGANYGEISFNCRFLDGQRVMLFEANPRLHPYLGKSIASRAKDGASFALVRKAVSASSGFVTFSVNKAWSGTSRIAGDTTEAQPDDAFVDIKVEATSIDEELQGGAAGTLLLCKIDVEGHEVGVLKGMKGTLAQARGAALVVEFNRTLSDIRQEELFMALRGVGNVYNIGKRGRVAPVENSAEITSRDVLVVRGAFEPIVLKHLLGA